MKSIATITVFLLLYTSCATTKESKTNTRDYYPRVAINQDIVPEERVLILITDESEPFIKTIKSSQKKSGMGLNGSNHNGSVGAVIALVYVAGCAVVGLVKLGQHIVYRRRRRKMHRAFRMINPALLAARKVQALLKYRGIRYAFAPFPKIRNCRIPLLRNTPLPESDRDFRILSDKTDARYVLEFRIIHLYIKQFGKRGRHSVTLRMKGILHDIRLRKKIWEANAASINMMPESVRRLTRKNANLLNDYVEDGIKEAMKEIIKTLKPLSN